MVSKTNLRELLEIAVSQLKDLTNVENPDFRLEQAEYDKKNEEWDLVVSFLVERTNKRTNALGIPSSEFQYNRIYKRLKINSDNQLAGLYIFNKDDSY